MEEYLMHPSIAPLVEIYKINTRLLLRAFRDISEDDTVRQPSDNSNSMLFIAGHMTSARFLIGKMAGLPDKNPWGDLFARRAPLKDQSDYPTLADIIENWKSFSEEMIEKLSGLSDDDVRMSSPRDFPGDDKTMVGAFASMALHDSYHIGQLAYIRKLLGYESLVG